MKCNNCGKEINKNVTSYKSCSSKCARVLLEALLIPAWVTWVEDGEDYSKIPGGTKELKERNSSMIGMVRGGASLRDAGKYGGVRSERIRQIIAKFIETMIDYSE